MKPFAAVLGLTAACAACCAIPIALPAILAVAGLTSASFGMGSVAVVIGAAATMLFGAALWQRAKMAATAPSKNCGSENGCGRKTCR